MHFLIVSRPPSLPQACWLHRAMPVACLILATQAVGAQLHNEPGKLTSPSGAFGPSSENTFEGYPAARATLYAKYEIGFARVREYDNPFDPEQISVEAVCESPSGKTIRVPGFSYQDYPADSVRREKSFEGKAGPSGLRIRLASRGHLVSGKTRKGVRVDLRRHPADRKRRCRHRAVHPVRSSARCDPPDRNRRVIEW